MKVETSASIGARECNQPSNQPINGFTWMGIGFNNEIFPHAIPTYVCGIKRYCILPEQDINLNSITVDEWQRSAANQCLFFLTASYFFCPIEMLFRSSTTTSLGNSRFSSLYRSPNKLIPAGYMIDFFFGAKRPLKITLSVRLYVCLSDETDGSLSTLMYTCIQWHCKNCTYHCIERTISIEVVIQYFKIQSDPCRYQVPFCEADSSIWTGLALW